MARGDHLFYYRVGSAYSHHGIDCGDGTVVHYESSTLMKIAGFARSDFWPEVKRVVWEDFAMGHEVFVREYDDCDSVEAIMHRAEGRLGERDYDVFGNNCEHFAVWCKTGQALSTQVDAVRKANRAALQSGSIGALLIRASRRLPGVYRGWAVGGAVAITGASYVGAYVSRRLKSMRERES